MQSVGNFFGLVVFFLVLSRLWRRQIWILRVLVNVVDEKIKIRVVNIVKEKIYYSVIQYIVK